MTDFPSSPETATVPREPTREMWAAMADAIVGKTTVHRDVVVAAVYEAMLASAPSFDLAQTPAEPGMQGAVQYRRKDGGYGPGWITMAMFDGTLAAENYLAIQRKDENCPYEYRAIELPAVSDTSTDRGGK